jgi:hypothetical protein
MTMQRSQSSLMKTRLVLTQEDTTGHTRDALDLCDIILYKVLIAGGAGARAIAEESPERSGHRAVVDHLHFGTGVEAAL